MTECEPYGDQGRVACATKVSSPTGDVTVIAGLHHEEGDLAFDLPNCDEFTLTLTPRMFSTTRVATPILKLT